MSQDPPPRPAETAAGANAETAAALPTRRRPPWLRYLALVGLMLLLAAGALVVLWTTGASLGLRGTLVGTVAAILPAPLFAACFIWLGRHNRTPLLRLAFAFAWGACVSTAISLGVNSLVHERLDRAELRGAPNDVVSWPDFYTAVISAPVIEELTKWIGPLLLVLLLVRRGRRVAGTEVIGYFGLSALGFAMVENIIYMGRAFVEGSEGFGAGFGALSVVGVVLVRILLSGFAHPLFTAIAALGVVLALRRRPGAGRWLLALAFVPGAMALHSVWNLMASSGNPTVLLSGYVALMMPLFFTAVGTALWMRSAEARRTAEQLRDYVRAGWLSPPEAATLSTFRRRSAAREWARRTAGARGARAMREFQQLAARLAELRGAAADGAGSAARAAEEAVLLQHLSWRREVYTGRDPRTPPVRWDGAAYLIAMPDGRSRRLGALAVPVAPVPVAMYVPQPVYPHPGYAPPRPS